MRPVQGRLKQVYQNLKKQYLRPSEAQTAPVDYSALNDIWRSCCSSQSRKYWVASERVRPI